MSKKIFTNSYNTRFLNCKKKHRLATIDLLSPILIRKPLDSGLLAHLLFESLYTIEDTSSFDSICNNWREDKIKDVDESIRKYLDIQDANTYPIYPNELIERTEKETNEIVDETSGVISHYAKTVYENEKDRYEPIWIEKTLKVHFNNEWDYALKPDLLMRDREFNTFNLWDHKLTGDMPSRTFKNMYANSTQKIAYSYATVYTLKYDKDVAGKYIGSNLSGFAHNILRRKIPSKPHLLKTRTKDGKPRLSKSKDIDTTYEIYLESINEHDLDPNDYRDVLDKLKMKVDSFHFRESHFVTNDMIKEWYYETVEVIRDIDRTNKAILDGNKFTDYKNPDHCKAYGKKNRCEFWPLCYGDKERSMMLFKKTILHPEL